MGRNLLDLLPERSPGIIKATTLLSRLSIATEIETAELSQPLELNACSAVTMPGDTIFLMATSEQGTLVFEIPDLAVDLICDLVMPIWRDQTGSSVFRELRAGFALGTILEKFGISLEKWRIYEVAAPPDISEQYILLWFADHEIPLKVWIADCDPSALSQWSTANVGSSDIFSLRLALGMTLPELRLPIAQITDIEVGDIFVLPEGGENIPITLQIGDKFSLAAELSAEGTCTLAAQ